MIFISNYRKKKLPKYLLPQSRNRYFVSTHFVDHIDNAHYTYSQYAPSKKVAQELAKKREKENLKYKDHSLIDIYSTIERAKVERKYKVKNK